jgi:hypothetical protein
MDHVARLRSMVSRHLHLPHRFICVTDSPESVPDGVEAVATPDVPLMAFRNTRWLWQYSREAAAVLGARILALNLDIAIVGDITPLVSRQEPFVIYRSESRRARGFAYNTTMALFDGGARADIWERFVADPSGLLEAARADGWGAGNSDQSVVSYVVHPDGVPTWDESDGVIAYRVRGPGLPKGAKLVSFHGHDDPADPAVQAKSPWILEHWR